ncbi:hypothetical protein [Metabacillus sp. Hm71]|uniref:hypothetical protein n=1 Tax=Metabacillus sp. Hm71 TaxID=3450743 RepID=UPI003F42BBE5
MKIERIFNEESNITLQDTLKSVIDEFIDRLVDTYYSQDKVNTTTSHAEGKEVS